MLVRLNICLNVLSLFYIAQIFLYLILWQTQKLKISNISASKNRLCVYAYVAMFGIKIQNLSTFYCQNAVSFHLKHTTSYITTFGEKYTQNRKKKWNRM